MTYSIAVADDDLVRFAHDLTRDNMAPYYATHGRIWDTTLFNASWPHTENYCVREDAARVGILRIAQEDETLWVRDVQILPAHQGRGAGTFAMRFAGEIAAERGTACIRLKVFADNRAQSLYLRLGFRELSRERGVLLFEQS